MEILIIVVYNIDMEKKNYYVDIVLKKEKKIK